MDENDSVSDIWTTNEIKIKFTYYPGHDFEKYRPFTQIYGVCFNDEGKILIQREENNSWCLPGGTVEEGESPLDTLGREILEETDVTIKNPIMLGGQKVEVLEGHIDPKRGGNNFFQLRYYCEIEKILPQTPDPDNGIIHERKFVNPSEITEYFDWGKTGAAIFKQATDLHQNLHRK